MLTSRALASTRHDGGKVIQCGKPEAPMFSKGITGNIATCPSGSASQIRPLISTSQAEFFACLQSEGRLLPCMAQLKSSASDAVLTMSQAVSISHRLSGLTNGHLRAATLQTSVVLVIALC